jgi:hypothetical protein
MGRLNERLGVANSSFATLSFHRAPRCRLQDPVIAMQVLRNGRLKGGLWALPKRLSQR